MKVQYLSAARPIAFAAQELERILAGLQLELRLELFSSEEENDSIRIDVENRVGVIAGNNPRSVLIAAYRYMTSLGVEFTGFGKKGEKTDCIDAEKSVHVHETASYFHRGVCIEGAVSLENVFEMVDLIPKLSMNAYFIQFREAFAFFDRWYKDMTVERAREYVRQIAEEIDKRGLMYHAVGHGWTCEPFGIQGLSWKKHTGELSEEVCENFALLNGRRELFGGVALNTSACYGNPIVRDKITDSVCDYLEQNPSVSYLHFWLADGLNNQCECDMCNTRLPSDHYIVMLNELDEKLEKRGIDAKIVFLIYLDLLWPPKQERLKNPSRFTLMFAPISRTYRSSFDVPQTLPELPEYVRNKLPEISSVEQNVAFLRAWQKIAPVSGFDFDYHYMWEHVRDFGRLHIAKTLSADIKKLGLLGLSGFISCQVGRACLPNALGLVVMGETLWDKTREFDDICRRYLGARYGDEADAVRDYMEKMSDFYMQINFNDKTSERNAARVRICADAIDYIDSRSYPTCLAPHAELYKSYIRALREWYGGNSERARIIWEETLEVAASVEKNNQSDFDLFNFESVLKQVFN